MQNKIIQYCMNTHWFQINVFEYLTTLTRSNPINQRFQRYLQGERGDCSTILISQSRPPSSPHYLQAAEVIIYMLNFEKQKVYSKLTYPCMPRAAKSC